MKEIRPEEPFFNLSLEQVRDVLLPMAQRALDDLSFSMGDVWNSDIMKLKLNKERENYLKIVEEANEFLIKNHE